MNKSYNKEDSLLKVENPIIGKAYHLAWAYNGCIWNLKEINGENIVMQAKVSKKIVHAKLSDLRHTRKQQEKLNKNGQ